MLSTNSTSSIQRRRQHHRRQQSLEIPILATPLPTNHRRNQPPRAGHRRGLSLDQSLGSHGSHQTATGFRPLLPQDAHGLPSGPLSARTITDTNPAQPLEPQHYVKQETQEQSLSQPGFHQPQLHHPQPAHQIHASGFQNHLHQQLNGYFNSGAPIPSNEQAAAMHNLQSHLSWYQETYGCQPQQGRNIQGPLMPSSLQGCPDVPTQIYIGHPGAIGISGPNSMHLQHSKTVPNTPQERTKGWASPPQGRIKHSRSHSHQMETVRARRGYHGDSFQFPEDQNCEASTYSSSLADPASPVYQHNSSMPTVFEEDHGAMGADALLLPTAGAQDFNDPNFVIGGMCQEQATLDQMGIDATYIETGTKESDLDAWLESPHGDIKYYVCKWEGCAHPQINRKENARSHIQNHLDDRKWKCNPCGKRFTRLHDLKRHALTHTNERPAICPCGKSFARQDALTRHRQRDMCRGVLPGFEKSEEDKPKRGRPRKDRSGDNGDKLKKTNRPDMESRVQKAALSRAMEKVKAAASADQACMNIMSSGSGSSSSLESDHSMPDTPPQDSDPVDAVNFFDIDSAVSGITAASQAWLDTPPSSPPLMPMSGASAKTNMLCVPDNISPSKISDYSSPLTSEDFTSNSYYGGSSPLEPSDSMNSSFYAPSSTSNNQSKAVSQATPLTVITKTDAPRLSVSIGHDSVISQSSSAKDGTAVDSAIDATSEGANFSSFLSSVALTGATDFGLGGSCDVGGDVFSTTAALLDSYPSIGEDPFSPPGESNSGSSTYNSSDVDMINEKIFRNFGSVHDQVQSSIFSDRIDHAFGNPFDDPGLPEPTTEEQIEAFLAGL